MERATASNADGTLRHPHRPRPRRAHSSGPAHAGTDASCRAPLGTDPSNPAEVVPWVPLESAEMGPGVVGVNRPPVGIDCPPIRPADRKIARSDIFCRQSPCEGPVGLKSASGRFFECHVEVVRLQRFDHWTDRWSRTGGVVFFCSRPSAAPPAHDPTVVLPTRRSSRSGESTAQPPRSRD